MTAGSHADQESLNSSRACTIWHLRTVIVPRRSMAGRLVYGRVWRRHNGRRWIYKRFVDLEVEKQ
jgi:hypothetical protein